MANNSNNTKVITGPETRLSYANVLAPTSINGSTPKYSASLIIPKSDTGTVKKIKAAIQAAFDEGQDKLKGNSKSAPALAQLRTPLRDGDTEKPDDPAYANSYFLSAKSVNRPGLVDANLNPITDDAEIYSGIYCRASISFYPYNVNGSRGIACALNNLMKVSDGERLGGKPSAASDFADFGSDFLI